MRSRKKGRTTAGVERSVNANGRPVCCCGVAVYNVDASCLGEAGPGGRSASKAGHRSDAIDHAAFVVLRERAMRQATVALRRHNDVVIMQSILPD